MLKKGDKVATVSLSWGGAGDVDLLHRYHLAKETLKEKFGFVVVEMAYTLKGTEFIYKHPELRAQDLMNAFKDPEIKAVFACIGGTDSVRMLPYIDYEVIANNPKPFIGYSDSTTTHLICYKAGVQSFYGPSLLAEFGEYGGMYAYTQTYFEHALISDTPMFQIEPSPMWTSERIEWLEENIHKRRQTYNHEGFDFVQGSGMVQGHLLGGCVEVLNYLKGTEIYPSLESFKGAVLFIETSETQSPAWYFEDFMRNLGTTGVLSVIKGCVVGKPYNNSHYDAYRSSIIKVLKEFQCDSLPVVMNMNFGHTQPMITIPYGAIMRIDMDRQVIWIVNQ